MDSNVCFSFPCKFFSGPTMISASRTASLSDLLAFNPHSRAASNNNSSGGAKHKLYNPVVTPDFL